MEKTSSLITKLKLRTNEKIVLQGKIKLFSSKKAAYRSKPFNDLVIITNMRIIIFNKKLFSKSSKLAEIEIRDIISISAFQSQDIIDGEHIDTYYKYVLAYVKTNHDIYYFRVTKSKDFKFIQALIQLVQTYGGSVSQDSLAYLNQLNKDLGHAFDKVQTIRILQYILSLVFLPADIYYLINFGVSTANMSILERVLYIWHLIIILIAIIYLNFLGNNILVKKSKTQFTMMNFLLGMTMFSLPINLSCKVVLSLIILLFPILQNLIRSYFNRSR